MTNACTWRLSPEQPEKRLSGPFADLEMIREDSAMPVLRFCALIGIPRRAYHRNLSWYRAGAVVGKGPWPAPAVDLVEPVAATYAADWSAWGTVRSTP